MQVEPIRAGSVSELAYDRIRALIVDGHAPAGTRLRQGELADAFRISRTSVREALHRLTAEELVEFERNRGFFVAEPPSLTAVLHRLEVRLLLEPGIARLAAERRTEDDVSALRRAVAGEGRARSPRDAHDLGRDFHMRVAHATANSELAQVMGSLWTVDVGRQLLARRSTSPTWKAEDVAEHEAISEAIAVGDADRAAELMRKHVAAAYAHWSEAATSDQPNV